MTGTSYLREGETLRAAAPEGDGAAIWIDLVAPDEAQLERFSKAYGIALPRREDQEEIEQSSRLCLDEGRPVMTVMLPARAESGEMQLGPVSFVLLEDRLITIRHHDLRPFDTFPAKARKASPWAGSPEAVLTGLLEEIVDHLADTAEQAGRGVDGIARRIFGSDTMRTEDYRAALREIGSSESRIMQLRESLMTLERMLSFLGPVMEERKASRALCAMQNSQYHDVRAVAEQAGCLQQKTAFLLDAALGLIEIEQNAIIKIFSVAAVAFLPPTLVASIYGMNFWHMPELGWTWGCPLALAAMVLSAALPLWFFRRRGWL